MHLNTKAHPLAFLLLLGTVVLYSQKKETPYHIVDSLIQSENVSNNINALKLLEGPFIKDSITAAYWQRYAQACFNSLRYSKSIESIDKAIGIQPNNSETYFIKAKQILKIRNDLKEAIGLMNTAIAKENKGEHYFYRGIYHQMDDNDQAAIKDYDAAMAAGFEHSGLYRNYAILLLKHDDPKSALRIIEKAITANPNAPDNYSTRGQIYSLLIAPEKACTDFEKAVSLGYNKTNDIHRYLCIENASTNKHKTLADILVKMEKYAFAIKAYTLTIEKEKDSSRHYLNRGYCHYKLKEYEQAEQDYLMTLKLSTPTVDLLYNNLSLLYFDQGKYEQSITYATKRIDLNPKNQIPYIDRGIAYRRLRKYAEAEKDFNTSLSINANYFRAYAYRAYLHYEKNNFQKAYDDAKKSVVLNPEYAYGHMVLGLSKQKLKIDDFCNDFKLAKIYGDPDATKALEAYCK